MLISLLKDSTLSSVARVGPVSQKLKLKDQSETGSLNRLVVLKVAVYNGMSMGWL